nr:GGDEF and EAL domain-containing protein [Rhabdothermincola salaria]
MHHPTIGADALAKLLRNSAETVTLLGPDGRVRYEGGNTEPTLGYESLASLSVEDLLHPDDIALYRAARLEVLSAPGAEVHGEVRVGHRDGGWAWVEFTARNRLDDPDLNGIVLTTRNATDRRRSDRLLAGTAQVLEAIAASRSLDEIVDLVRHLVADQGDVELAALPADVSALAEVLATSSFSAAEEASRLLGLARSSHRVASELRRRALVDDLTGLANRTGFTEALRRHLEGPRRPSAVLLFDLDRFKQVNDAYGHSTGDALLERVADALRRVVRVGDVAARFGGDEFAVLCDALDPGDPEQAAAAVGRRLALALNNATEPESHLRIAASIGISVDDGTGARWRDPEAWIADADHAMYEAKRRGRGRVVLADDTTRRAVGERQRTEVGLRAALDDGSLEVWCQPIVRLSDRQVVAAEALLRWRHDDGRLRSPAEFLQVAEDSGLMGAISVHTITKAIEVAAGWPDRSDLAPVLVAVNLSATQLLADDLVAVVQDALRRCQVQPGRLVVELTEHVLAADVDLVVERLSELRDLGVSLVLDDFGTGWSSLQMVRTMPFDAVKVDRSFIAEMGSDPVADDFVVRIVELLRTLGREVVAEGVEHEEQMVPLRRAGCEFGQGWLFGHPVAVGAFAETYLGVGALGEVG